jgi:pyrroline-5-carboxylate reductase
MREAGSAMGLTPAQSYQLAIATFSGASALAAASSDAPEVLRERVTSKGGTTFAALSAMEQAGIKPAFIAAMQAARQRAQELGDAFGAQL